MSRIIWQRWQYIWSKVMPADPDSFNGFTWKEFGKVVLVILGFLLWINTVGTVFK